MAKCINNPDLKTLPSGNIKGTGYQIRRVHGQAFLVKSQGKRVSFSSAEQKAQQRFAEATRLAGLDMKNPHAKAHWNANKGKYKRAYDAAKAHYLHLLNSPQSEPLIPPKPENPSTIFPKTLISLSNKNNKTTARNLYSPVGYFQTDS